MKLDIKALAKEAGFTVSGWDEILAQDEGGDARNCADELRRFAELVEAVTREDDALTLEASAVVSAGVRSVEMAYGAHLIRALKSA